MKNDIFIGVSGMIGAGKSTLTKALAERLQFQAYHEPLKDNPYLGDFYNDMERWGAFMQLHLLHSFFQQHQEILKRQNGVIQDRVFQETVMFAEHLHKQGHMNVREMSTYNMAVNNMTPFVKHPDVLVFLDISPEVSMERIKLRNRESEKPITLEYLKGLHAMYKDWVQEMSEHTTVLRFDCTNFGKVEEVIETINNL